MKKKKVILSIIFFIAVVALTFYVIFSKNDVSSMISAIKMISSKYLIILLLIILGYFIVHGYFYKVLLSTLNVKINIFRGMFYAITEFLFGAITPGAAGGQALVLYYMNKDGISAKKSSIILMYSTIIFKSYLLLFALFIIIFKNDMISSYGPLVLIMFIAGIAWIIITITAFFMLMYNQNLIKKILRKSFSLVNKLFKKKYNIDEKVNDIVSQYSNNAKLIKTELPKLIYCFLITFVQRTLMFSIVYVIYRGFGFHQFGYFDFLILQTFIQICLEAMFIPGATGVSELLSNSVFVTYFDSLATVSMLLFRTVSFYLPLLVIAILLFVIVKIKYKKK